MITVRTHARELLVGVLDLLVVLAEDEARVLVLRVRNDLRNLGVAPVLLEAHVQDVLVVPPVVLEDGVLEPPDFPRLLHQRLPDVGLRDARNGAEEFLVPGVEHARALLLGELQVVHARDEGPERHVAEPHLDILVDGDDLLDAVLPDVLVLPVDREEVHDRCITRAHREVLVVSGLRVELHQVRVVVVEREVHVAGHRRGPLLFR